MNRAITNDHQSQARALPTAETKYNTASRLSVLRRPKASDGLLLSQAPRIVPIRALAVVQPCQKPGLLRNLRLPILAASESYVPANRS